MALKMIERSMGKYVVVKTACAGVFAGVLVDKDGSEVVLTDCRHIWFDGVEPKLSQLAVDVAYDFNKCRFASIVDEIYVAGVVELIPVTAEAEKRIRTAPVYGLCTA